MNSPNPLLVAAVLVLILWICVIFTLPTAQAAETEFSVDFSANVTSGYAPLGVHFLNEVIGNQVSGYWMIGETRYNQTTGPDHLFDQPGLYNVSLTITDDTNTTLTAVKLGYINVSSRSPTESISFIDHSMIGDRPLQIIDRATGDTAYNGNTSGKDIRLDPAGSYQIMILPGGWKDLIAMPDFGISRSVEYARTNPIGAVFGGLIVGILLSRLFG